MPAATARLKRNRAVLLVGATLSSQLDGVLAEPARCRKVAIDNSSSAARSGFDIGERYIDIQSCGNFSLLVSRLQPNLREFEWITTARAWHDGYAGRATRLLPRSWHMSHNAAMVCANNTLHVFGGQYRNYTVGKGENARGIFHASASDTPAAGGAPQWSPPSLQLEGFHRGCTERRSKFAGYCEFDGQLSVVFYNGHFLLYARANMAAGGGARHVQMTSAPSDLSSWSRFRIVQLVGVKAGRTDSNIYFFNVQVVDGRLLALFPAVFPPSGSAGIYASSSTDGVEWSRPQRLLRVPGYCSRTRVHPIRLVGNHLYLLNNVDISEPSDVPPGHTHTRSATRPYLQRVLVEVDFQTVLGLDQMLSSVSLRVHNWTWDTARVGPAFRAPFVHGAAAPHGSTSGRVEREHY